MKMAELKPLEKLCRHIDALYLDCVIPETDYNDLVELMNAAHMELEAARKEMQERCAKVCDDVVSIPDPIQPWEKGFICGADLCAKKIRKMGDR